MLRTVYVASGPVEPWAVYGGWNMANKNDDLNLAKGQPAEEGAAGGSGGRKKLIYILLALLVLGGAAAGGYFMLGGKAGPEMATDADGEPAAAPEEPEDDPIYLALSPAFVINFEITYGHLSSLPISTLNLRYSRI